MVVQSVEVHDTLREVTTITVNRNDRGDTLRLVQVTERDRYRYRDRVRDVHQKTVVKTDTVYVAIRDSVSSSKFQGSIVQGSNKKNSFVSSLKWIFAILCASIILIIVIKIGLRRSLL